MRFATRTAIATGLTTLCLAFVLPAGAAMAQIQVVSAGGEFAAAHPRPKAKVTAASGDFHTTMNEVFGPGRWRLTSGYRTQAQENALRRQGAGTVAPGRTSLHSVGAPDAPGAYDAVVDNMSLSAAAAKLKRAGAFNRVLAEGAHGPQGAHLHVELASATTGAAPAAEADDTVYERVIGGRRNPRLSRGSTSGAAEN